MSKRIPIFIGLLLLGFFVWLSITNNPPVRFVLSRLDNIFYDMQLRLHVWAHPAKPQGTVVVVDVDDASLKALGRWPWPRSIMAKLINQLKSQGAVVVATDIMFLEPDVNIVERVITRINEKNLGTPELMAILQQVLPDFEQDKLFAGSLQQMDAVLGMVFLPTKHESGALAPPLLVLNPQEQKELHIITAEGFSSNIPVLQQASKSEGFLNIFPDSDGVIRHVPLLIRYQNGLYPSLALKAVQDYMLTIKIKLFTPYYGDTIELEGVDFGQFIIPTDREGQILIPFIGGSYTFPYYSAADVLSGKTPAGTFAGKIVFIGTSATGEGDIKTTAVDRVYPGVEVQATVANALLTHYFPYKPGWARGAELVFTIIIGLLAAFIFPYLGPVMVSLLLISIPLAFVAFLLIEESLWSSTGFIFSIVIPTLLITVFAVFNVIYGYLFEARKRERLKRMFGQYVPKKHIDEMIKAKGSYGLLGEDREMTVLFADIRNFTSISEGMKASALKEMLNSFFTPMTEIIFKHRGTIDKYVGDMIMAFWGAPLKDKNHIRHALATGLEMQKKISAMAPEIEKRGWAKINMGIGINSGVMSVGDMGSKFRRNYTVLGDAVNLGSRVESLTKHYGVDIMTTESSATGQTGFIFRQLDRVRVKGKQEGINIYQLVCEKVALGSDLEAELLLHHQALNLYFAKQFDAAQALFQQLHQAHPGTKVYDLYLERIAVFKTTPPPENWDGVYTHTSK